MLSNCCDAEIYPETIMDDCGMCSACKEYSGFYDEDEEEEEN